MRYAALVLGAVLFFAAGVGAQTTAISAASQAGSSSAHHWPFFALAAPGPTARPFTAARKWLVGTHAAPPIYGILPDYDWQLYGGFTYTRFYEYPGSQIKMFGFDLALDYYPHIKWLAPEADISTGFGSQSGTNYQFVSEMGGLKLRWPSRRGTNVWVHGLAGGVYLAPKTVYGGQNAFGFQAGGGADLAHPGSRISYRLEGDIVGTFFFGTYQYSPKVSVGLVYRF